MKSKLFELGGGAGIGSYIVVVKDGQLGETDPLKVRASFDAGESLFLSIADDSTEEALLPLSGYVSNDGVLRLAGRDFDDGKTYKLTIGEEAELEIEDGISTGDLGDKKVASDSYYYIHDEASWNAAYNDEHSALKAYYDKYPDEDRWVFVDMEHLQNDDPTGGRPAKASDKVEGQWPENIIQCWWGAVGAPGAKYPWIVPHFDSDVNAILEFRYEGKEPVRPWGDNVFGIGRKPDGSDRLWGIASVAEEFKDKGFLIPENKNNYQPDWTGEVGANNFDIEKFQLILIKQDESASVKEYIDEKTGGEGYITIGQTKLTEEQLIKLLALI